MGPCLPIPSNPWAICGVSEAKRRDDERRDAGSPVAGRRNGAAAQGGRQLAQRLGPVRPSLKVIYIS
jgi:hypothetical protein